MKNIIFLRKLPDTATFGGCEKHILDWMKALDYSKINLTLIVSKGKANIFEKRINDIGLPIKLDEFPFSFNVSFLKRFLNMLIFLKPLKPDLIVYTQGGFYEFLLPDFLAGFLLTKGKIYCFEESAPPILFKSFRASKKFKLFSFDLWWYKEVFFSIVSGWLCKKIIAVSKEVRNRLVAWYHFPEGRIFTCYHGVDLKEYFPDSIIRRTMREKMNIGENDIVFVSTARFSKEKCVDRLVNSFDVLAKEYKNLWLLCIGEGILEREIRSLAKNKVSADKILFLGYQEKVAPFLKMSDIFILSSDVEGLPIALLEAMATGLICVATKTSGVNEIIEDGLNGFLVEKNEHSIYLSLRNILKLTEEEKKKMSINAQHIVNNNFEIGKKVEEALKIMELV